MLSKELAFQWANGNLPVLCNCVLLFLLPLHDPDIKKIISFEDIGSKVAFIFDGYDEFPEQLRSNIFFISSMSKKILSSSKVVITSCPHVTFTIEEVVAECPTIHQVPGAIDGFGLLRTVQHFSSRHKAATYSVDFIHFSVQEFLAAYYFAGKPKNEQLNIFQLHF